MANKKNTADAAAPKKPGKSLDENLKYLRDTLAGDPLLGDINQEEALEFLDAVEADICNEREAYTNEIESLKAEVSQLDNEVSDLNCTIKNIEDEREFDSEIKTVDSIRWEAVNLMDQAVMEALEVAYEKLSPAQIIDRLKVS